MFEHIGAEVDREAGRRRAWASLFATVGVGAAVGLAYLRAAAPVTAASLAGARFEVDVAGRRHAVQVSLRAPLA